MTRLPIPRERHRWHDIDARDTWIRALDRCSPTSAILTPEPSRMQRVVLAAVLLSTVFAPPVLAQTVPVRALSPEELSAAIELGRNGVVPIVQIAPFAADCVVFIEDATARVAAASARARAELRPFTDANVTAAMKSPLVRVFVRNSQGISGCSYPSRIVLQPKDARGMDRVVQPVREAGEGSYFDQIPATSFDVVVASSGSPHRYGVSDKQRAEILRVSAELPVSPPIPAGTVAVQHASAKRLRLFVQGDGAHVADAIRALQNGLSARGIVSVLTKRGEPYDYAIVFAEGDRDAATALALDENSDVIGVAVHGAFTLSGAVEGASRDLAKKLLAVTP